jgi:hypothetical protein
MALVDLAGLHNVCPALVRNLAVQLRLQPDSLLGAGAARRHDEIASLLAQADDLRLAGIARAILLADVARTILSRLEKAGVPAVLVKGLDFAEKAYGGLGARTFSDIDLLVRRNAEEELGAVLRELGFRPQPVPERHVGRTERPWIRREDHGGAVLVEVHTDIVHAPELRAGQSMTYDLYAGSDGNGPTAAARLVLAGLHGATSHLFGRLQYVVDGLMIARMGVDARELKERAHRCRAELPVATMLRLAAEIYGCSVCASLLDGLAPIPWRSLERRLIPASMVLAAKNKHRWLFLPQRRVYRKLLQHSAAQ